MKGVLILLVAVLAVVGLLFAFQRRLIYFPTQVVPDPAAFPRIEEVSFPTDDGLVLTAWFLPDAGSERAGTVMVLNGNAGNRAGRVPIAEAFAELGYAVLLVDYRGYGGNPGSPSEAGLASDAQAARAWLGTRPEVDVQRLIYFGESLGAAVALALSQESPPSALVLRSPFTSLVDVGAMHYPFLPTSLLLRDRYPSSELISNIDVPVMVIAGSQDRVVPLSNSKALFEAAPGPKQLLVVDGADHNDLELLAGNQMIEAVADFLDRALPPMR